MEEDTEADALRTAGVGADDPPSGEPRLPTPAGSGLPPSPRGRLRLADRTFTGCDDDQNFQVDFALLRVPVWINSVIADLEDYRTRPREIVTVTESALHRFFHPPGTRLSGTTIGVITRRLERMRDVLLAAGGIRCVTERGCRARFRDALAFAGPATPVSLCPSFFDQSLNDQVSTLIHEAAHRIGLMRNVIPRDDVAALPLHQAMNNAESYALLVTEVFWGPPAAPGPPPPVPLTPSWSASHMSSAIELEAPRRGTYHEGRGTRHLLSDEQRSFSAPFPSTQPFNFRGRVRYYLDSRETPLPGGTPMPTVRAQVLFIPGPDRTVPMFVHDDPTPVYAGPGLPLVVGFDTRFDFMIVDNGDLRFTLWLEVAGPEGLDMAAMFDDTVQVQPQNDI